MFGKPKAIKLQGGQCQQISFEELKSKHTEDMDKHMKKDSSEDQNKVVAA